MKATRLFVVALCATFAFACTDHTPTAAPQPPQASLIGSLGSATGLVKCSDLPFAQSTATIGPDGGSISAGPHTLTIPAGALSAPVTITMTAPTGRGVNAVEFAPEGLQFARSASLTMSYANCTLLGNLLPKRIAYVSSNLDILYYILSLDNILAKRVTGQVNHFSDYVVAW